MSKQLTPRESGSRRRVARRLLLAALALTPVAGPLGAQSIRMIDEDEPLITVQNNRDEAVTIYLDTGPFEQKLGTVEPLTMATLSLPWTVRGKETVKFLIQPKGEMGLMAEASVRDEVPRLSLLLDEESKLSVRTAQVAATTGTSGTMITVENDEDEPADVLVVHGMHEHRLGRVAGESTQTFVLTGHEEGEQGRIVLVPEGGSALLTPDVVLTEMQIDIEID
jgi:hypothetical protein